MAARLDAPYVQLDALYWGPDWTPRSENEFQRAVRAAVAGSRWVVDGNYSRLRPLIWPRASHVIWLNYSFPRTMLQLLVRTVRRSLRAEKLFSCNRESWRRSFLSRDSILLWGLRSFWPRRRRYRRLAESGDYPNLTYIELSSPTKTEWFLRKI